MGGAAGVKAIGFFKNTGPSPLEIHKSTQPDSILVHHQPDNYQLFVIYCIFLGKLVQAPTEKLIWPPLNDLKMMGVYGIYKGIALGS